LLANGTPAHHAGRAPDHRHNISPQVLNGIFANGDKAVQFQYVNMIFTAFMRRRVDLRRHDNPCYNVHLGWEVTGAIMTKSNTSKRGGAKKPGSQSASCSTVAKKRIRRVIFKADEWYEAAALSIGIAGRSKPSRPMQLFLPRGQGKAN